jgi:hypothetical protein
MSDSVAGTVSSNTSTIQTIESGRGQGQGNAAGRTNRNSNLQNQNNNNNRGNRPQPTSKGNFKGSTTDMNAHVFECYEERGDRTQFPRTLEALGEYAAKNLKYPEDLKPMFGETMITPTLTAVPDIQKIHLDENKSFGKQHLRLIPHVRMNSVATSLLSTLSFGDNVVRPCALSFVLLQPSLPKIVYMTVFGFWEK